jgi:hypothetical protein
MNAREQSKFHVVAIRVMGGEERGSLSCYFLPLERFGMRGM